MRLRAVVPATSANIGPGFDCFGLALDLCNEVAIDTEAHPSITWEGEGAGELSADGNDMVGLAIAHTARVGGAPLPAFGRHGLNRIPLERGLGSSAAACVAGILLADRILGLKLEPEEVLELATDLEGHADNAAAAIAGGLTLAFGDGVVRLDPHPDLRPVVLVPSDVRLPTAQARAILDDTVSRADAVFNSSHAAAAVVALIARPELLTQVLEDRLHQEARLALAPPVKALYDRLRGLGVPVCLSGAGPSLLAFELPGETVPEPGEGWRTLRPAIRSLGAELRDE
jgi:homoserine kinase